MMLKGQRMDKERIKREQQSITMPLKDAERGRERIREGLKRIRHKKEIITSTLRLNGRWRIHRPLRPASLHRRRASCAKRGRGRRGYNAYKEGINKEGIKRGVA